MEFVDYTGKLNNHSQYLELMRLLEEKCKYIEYVLIDEDDIMFTDKFQDLIVSVKLKNKWWGTKSSRGSKIYRLRSSKEIFTYLKKFETFYKFEFTDMGDYAEATDFGINDIAFFDNNEMPLLFTTTHEGYIMIRKDLVI